MYKLGVGIIGAALTIDFAWWVSVFAMFGYVVCGGCPETWSGFSGQAFVGLWDFFKLSLASGVMLSYVLVQNCAVFIPFLWWVSIEIYLFFVMWSDWRTSTTGC